MGRYGMSGRFSLRVIVLVAAVFFLWKGGFAQVSTSPGSMGNKITTPTPGKFPIVAVTVFNSETGPKPGDISVVRDCGFNVCMQSATPENFDKLLDIMKDEGSDMKLILYNSVFANNPKDVKNSWKKTIPEFVNRYKDNPLVGGWELKDEPRWDDLAGLGKHYELLRQTDGSRFVLINLVGQIYKDFTGPCKTLEAYLDSVGKVFDMDVWSSDFYPIMIRNGKFQVDYEGFYLDLKAFSAKAKSEGVPMWAYCESLPYKSKFHTRPAATEPYLSFEAFSALAYGAQGIVYWTYWQRPSNSVETYFPALVDLSGKKTKSWYAAQKVNTQIRALTSVFLGARMERCVHTGMIGMKGTVPFVSGFGPLDELSADVKGVLVSHLRNDGHDYLMVVNHDVQKKQKVKIKFKNNVTVSELKVSDKGSLSNTSVKSNITITLSPGGYVLYEWK